MSEEKITQETVKELIHYEPETGVAFWKKRDAKFFSNGIRYSAEGMCNRFNKKYEGKRIGCREEKGYISISFLGRSYRLHRIIWLYMTGEWPDQVDHLNGIRSDNRWENLRNVSAQENCKNMKLQFNKRDLELPIGVTKVLVKSKSINGIKEYKYLRVDISEKGKSIKKYFRLIEGKEACAYENALKFRDAIYEDLGYHKNHGKVI